MKAFVQELLETTQSHLSLFDSAICTSEIIPGSMSQQALWPTYTYDILVVCVMVLSVWPSVAGGKQKVKPSAEQLLREYVRPEQTDKGKMRRVAMAVFMMSYISNYVTTVYYAKF